MTRNHCSRNRDADIDPRIDAFEDAAAEWLAMSEDEREEQREADYQDWLQEMES